MIDKNEKIAALMKLSHALGDSQRQLAILGEGNASTRLTADSFLVKASGSSLGTLRETDLVECKSAGLLALLPDAKPSDETVDRALMDSRCDASAKKPSVEALFHAWFLTLPGIEYVGHTHAPAVNGILCSPRAKEFAEKRIFPDEVVCCDVESVFVPYSDPGLRLAQVIRGQTGAFMEKHQRPPRVILLESHGIITIGRTAEAVMAAMLMAEKAAAIWLSAAALGGPKFMTASDVARIAKRPDEEVRRKALKMS
jgi:rhamnose utilization protein RhaD (predicted bifunctional aldolase and dehydrogenase)